MVLITDFTVSKNTVQLARINWDAVSTDLSWFYKDGLFDSGPIYPDAFDDPEKRDVEADLVSGRTLQPEIHDLEDDFTRSFDGDLIETSSIYARPNSKPFIYWSPVTDAAKYKIYHQKEGEAETLIDTIYPYDADLQEYQIIDALDGSFGKWHFFRVEVVDIYGNESSRALWRFWVYDLPDAISNLTVSNGSGSGLFDIEIIV